MSEDLLSDLCIVCHVNSHKYCCPRCTARTCSLMCAKKHKLRSQCNGIRDPTKYIRHAALLTPKGLDNDFNYLTGVERKLALARKDTAEKGINGGGGGPLRGKAKFSGNVSKLERILSESGAIIQRAPPGLTRARTNATKLLGKKHDQLRWTVEWVHTDGSSRLGFCSANQSISDAYNMHTKSLERDKLFSGPEANRIRGILPGDAVEIPEENPVCISDITESSTAGIPGAPGKDDLYFYLHLPRQPSRRRVLKALAPDGMPSSFLRGQIIVEYPTIYVLEKAPIDLPSGFILDVNFFKHRRKEDVLMAVPQNGLEDGEIKEERMPDVNKGKLEKLGDILSQDLEGLKGLVGISEVA